MPDNDNTSFHDEAPSDRNLNKFVQKKLAKGIVEDDDIDSDGDEYSKNLMEDEDFDSDNDDDFVTRK